MAGDPSNANVWANGDVYIGGTDAVTPVDATSTLPTGAAFGADWDLVGLLDGSEGFTETIDLDSNDFFAWGGILVASTKQHLKVTRTFTAFEENETVMGLWYPDSTLTFDETTGGYAGSLAIGDLQKKFKIGFQTVTGSEMLRVTTAAYAQIESRGDRQQNEEGLATFPFTVAIYPKLVGNIPVFWDVYKGAVPTP